MKTQLNISDHSMDIVNVNDLVNLLITKHNLNSSKIIKYIEDNHKSKSSLRIFFSGLIHKLSGLTLKDKKFKIQLQN
jgi:hypothetical protein